MKRLIGWLAFLGGLFMLLRRTHDQDLKLLIAVAAVLVVVAAATHWFRTEWIQQFAWLSAQIEALRPERRPPNRIPTDAELSAWERGMNAPMNPWFMALHGDAANTGKLHMMLFKDGDAEGEADLHVLYGKEFNDLWRWTLGCYKRLQTNFVLVNVFPVMLASAIVITIAVFTAR